MEDRESLFSELPYDWQAPNFNLLNPQVNLGKLPNMNMNIPIGTLSTSAFSELHQQPANNADEPHGWFYCLPRFRQSFIPIQTSPIFKDILLVETKGHSNEAVIPTFGSGSSQKSFLVFDQTGDQTTLMFSSGIKDPVKCPKSWSLKLPSASHLIENEPTKREPTHSLEDELNEDRGNDIGSEMHEDTEELNALLYSDSDSDYTDDDIEVTSKMTSHEQHFEESEEVASCNGETKNPPLSLFDTGNSSKRKRSDFSDYEDDDAHSSCANVKYPSEDETDFFSDDIKTKRERIRDTVKILQDIIPGGKGKNAVDVLDEAILYLNSLKLKVKTLGLDSL